MSHSRDFLKTVSKPRRSLPWLLAAHKTYSAQEVLDRLQADELEDPRTLAVHTAAAMTAVWSAELPERVAFDLGRAANRLPTVVFWYRQGLSEHEIGRRLSPFGTCWDAARALNAASSLIAQALNRGEITAQAA
jgi:hypothetical protein